VFEHLRELRAQKGITAQMMAERLGLETKASYYKKETGAVKFSLLEAKEISDYLGMSIEEVFFASEVSEMDTN